MFLVAFFLALRERSGRRQPPAERSPCTNYSYHVLVATHYVFINDPISVLSLFRFN